MAENKEEIQTQTPGGKKKRRGFFRVILSVLKWTGISLFGLLLLIAMLLYFPPFQDFAVKFAVGKVNEGGAMSVAVKKVRLTFPLDLSIDSLDLKMPGMTVKTARAEASMSLRRIIRGEIAADNLSASGADVTIGLPDSVMYMTVAMRKARIEDAGIRLSEQIIKVHDITADGGDVRMWLKPDSVPPPPVAPDSVPVRWHITLDQARMTNISYYMQLEPMINDLSCSLKEARMEKAVVDMATNSVSASEIAIDSVDARYIYYSPEYIAAYPVKAYEVPDTVPSEPWTVKVGKVRLNGGDGLYALLGYTAPTAAFDPEYIKASEINIAIDSFANRGTSVYVPIKHISARERCGVPLTLTGLFDMDSVRMNARNMLLTTPTSRVTLEGFMGMAPEGSSVTMLDLPLALKLGARLSNDDLRRLIPYPMTSMAGQLPRYADVVADIDVKGTPKTDLTIDKLHLAIPGHLELDGSGHAGGITAGINRMNANVEIKGSLRNGEFLKPMLVQAKLGNEINFPPLSIDGHFNARNGVIDGNLQAVTDGGDVALDASWNNLRQGYHLDLNANTFPVQSIMPGLGVKDVDAVVKITGEGLDPFHEGTALTADMDIRHLVYMDHDLDNITVIATLAGGMANFSANSANSQADFTLSGAGNLLGDTLRFNIDGDVRNLDLYALKLSPEVSEGSVKFSASAEVAADGSYALLPPLLAVDFALPAEEETDAVSSGHKGKAAHRAKKKPAAKPKNNASLGILDKISRISAGLNVADLYWRMPGMTVNGNDILLSLSADSASTSVKIQNHDLNASLVSPAPAGVIGRDAAAAMRVLDYCMKKRMVFVDSIQKSLPPFDLSLTARQDNILHNYLLDYDMSFGQLDFRAANDSVLSASGEVLEFRTGETKIDSIGLDMVQKGKYLLYALSMDNKPGTFDSFAKASASGYLGGERFSLVFSQENIDGDTGFSFGSIFNMPDSTTLAMRFVPFHPVIGYKEWTINRDNVITYNFATKHIDANINLHNDQSTLEILTEHDPERGDSVQEDLVVRLKDIQLADWLAINPFATPMKGMLSADMRLSSGGEKILNGKGNVSLKDFFYNRQNVGDFDLSLDLSTTPAGALHADVGMKINGEEAMTIRGALNDTTATTPMILDVRVIHLPLSVANPFLPPGTATLTGVLNGQMDMTGRMNEPHLNGWLEFDSATVVPTILGTSFGFPQTRIPVDEGVVKFNKYGIKTLNDNPLTIDGWVDISNLANMKLDLSLNADNSQIVGGKRKRSAEVYGKAFVDLDARVKGSMEYMQVTAAADLLPGSNVTYVMTELAQEITNQSNSQMVKFVNFADTTAVEDADTIVRPSMLMDINARLTIASGTTVAVDLTADGKSKVQLQANGTVNYTSDYMEDQHVTGRINLNQGFVRYFVPLIGEKNFTFKEGSYVAFNGDMLNPTLNILADDKVKANVSEQGSDQRQVTFTVSLDVTGTLESMNVVFDLSADDLTVENELKTMSPEQRASSAINLLVTNTYSGPGTKAAVGANPLFSLLESQLNNLAASAIKGVDLSFGINQLQRQGSPDAMSYSYQVSKSLFDDRFKIVVGGNYTTDADADENFAQNLIADISFEYLLNPQGTMYIRLFRHTGFESILEGEITQTGVGFTYRKRIRIIRDFFRKTPARPGVNVTLPQTPEDESTVSAGSDASGSGSVSGADSDATDGGNTPDNSEQTSGGDSNAILPKSTEPK